MVIMTIIVGWLFAIGIIILCCVALGGEGDEEDFDEG